MKKTTAFLMLGLMLSVLASCKKKEYTCEHAVSYIRVSVAFKGFSTDDLKEVVVNRYRANGQFNQLLSIDTFDYSVATFQGDTVYVNVSQYSTFNGLFSLAEGEDYTFNVLSKNEIYKISDVRDGDPYVSWTETERCSSGSTQTEFKPQLLNLNGQPVNAFYLNGSFLACLIR